MVVQYVYNYKINSFYLIQNKIRGISPIFAPLNKTFPKKPIQYKTMWPAKPCSDLLTANADKKKDTNLDAS